MPLKMVENNQIFSVISKGKNHKRADNHLLSMDFLFFAVWIILFLARQTAQRQGFS